MGNGSQSWLWPGETIIYWARQSPLGVLKVAVIMAFAAAGTSAAFDFFDSDLSTAKTVIAALITALTIAAPHFFVTFRRLELVLTSERLFYRYGLFRQKLGEIDLNDIAEIKGPKTGDKPFDLKFSNGKSLLVIDLPDLGRLRAAIAKASGVS